jgi:hypothetical protein
MINYIVTCHNSADHLALVLDALFRVRSQGNPIYCVLDGCTDNTESVISHYPVHKIFTPDVYEMRSLNMAFQQMAQTNGDLNFILQDDVILKDSNTETKVVELFRTFERLGIVALRGGANFSSDALTSGNPMPLVDEIENDHNVPDFQLPGYAQLPNGCVTFRQIAFKSPFVLPCSLYNAIGGYDERFAPVGHEDTEHCVRAINAGFRNMVAAIQVHQPMEWGGSRKPGGIGTIMDKWDKLHVDHMNLIRQLYGDQLTKLSANHPPTDELRLWQTTC